MSDLATGQDMDETTSGYDSEEERLESVIGQMNAGRLLVFETLASTAVHALSHRLSGAQQRISDLLNDTRVRENRLLLTTLTDVKAVLEDSIGGVRWVMGFARPHVPERSTVSNAHTEIHSVANLLRGYSGQKNCKLSLRLDAERTVVDVPPYGLQEILSTLVINSVQAQSRSIHITTENNEDLDVSEICTIRNALCISVTDDGDGIDEGQAEAIFEPSYSTKSNSQGLGLFIARILARKHGGELVCVAHRANRGAKFRLVLPVRHETE